MLAEIWVTFGHGKQPCDVLNQTLKSQFPHTQPFRYLSSDQALQTFIVMQYNVDAW